MSTLQRYVQREFLKIFAICFSGLLSSYFLVEFFSRIDLFVNSKSSLGLKVQYFLLKLPFFVNHVAPVAVLVASLVTLGILNRNRELTAIRSSGIMLYHICYPIVFWSLIVSGAVFVNNEFVVPLTEKKKIEVKDRLKGRPSRSVFRQSGIWYYGENNRIINIRLLDPAENRLEGVTVYQFDQSHTHITERIDSRQAVFRNGEWRFIDGTVRTFAEDGGITTFPFAERAFSMPEGPDDLSKYREDPDTMSFRALSQYIEKLRRSGFDPTRYVVDLYAKTAVPLISFVVALLGIPFAFRARPSGGIVASLGMSLALGFTYWILISMGVSLGHAAKAPPLIATWGPNVFFFFLGIYLWLNIDL